MSEEKVLLGQISRLAGQINRQRDAPYGRQQGIHKSYASRPPPIFKQSISKCHASQTRTKPNVSSDNIVSSQELPPHHHETIGLSHTEKCEQASRRQKPPPVLEVCGEKFYVVEEGRRLIHDSSSATDVLRLPSTMSIQGVHFMKGPGGHFYRSSSLDNSSSNNSSNRSQTLCRRFALTGRCYQGSRCPDMHDPHKVAICREFLRTGNCQRGSGCDLSHDATYERTPACSHYLRDTCVKDDCRYPHVKINPTLAICRDFAFQGFCQKGVRCQERHVFECPSYYDTGSCGNRHCRLAHIDRASSTKESRAKRHLSANSNSLDHSNGSDAAQISISGAGAIDVFSDQEDAISTGHDLVHL